MHVDRVLLAAPRGFCAGVEMAIKALAWMVRSFDEPVYCYHEIVHNKIVVDRFISQGVIFVDSIDEVPNGAPIMLSAHGSAPEVVSAPVGNTAPFAGSPTLVSEPTGSTATKLVIIEGEKTGQMVRLERREITLGRSPDSDLIVDDEYASTHHAKLILINNDWLIQDLNSTNGTYLDGSRVGTPAVVKLNTPVRVGKTVFELRS